MSKPRRWIGILCVGLWAAFAAGAKAQESGWGVRPTADRSETLAFSAPKPLLDGTVDPRVFGTQDYTITVISAGQFNAFTCVNLDPVTLSNECTCFSGCTGAHHMYASLDIPAGAVIDFIGVNNKTPLDATMGFTLHFRDHLGGTAQLASFSFPAHEGFVTDFAGPLGILVPGNHDRAFILDLERALVQDVTTWFGYVEIWWRRAVSDPPATPTFGDVSPSHPFYQFVEALAGSGVTGGCGGGNFCPDTPLTRGQMAVFLSKALGLHWPN